ncbi:MAG TPA: cold shock domain-containing protein [Bacteroidetes bacterium]|nr:cold shock domain-containing protein [Bacteroidota bacterium]
MVLDKIKAFFGWKEKPKAAKEPPSKKTGTIKYFNRKKGFGFIHSEQTPQDVYVHFRDSIDRIRKGDKVQFDVEENEKGLRARNVELVK